MRHCACPGVWEEGLLCQTDLTVSRAGLVHLSSSVCTLIPAALQTSCISIVSLSQGVAGWAAQLLQSVKCNRRAPLARVCTGKLWECFTLTRLQVLWSRSYAKVCTFLSRLLERRNLQTSTARHCNVSLSACCSRQSFCIVRFGSVDCQATSPSQWLQSVRASVASWVQKRKVKDATLNASRASF